MNVLEIMKVEWQKSIRTFIRAVKNNLLDDEICKMVSFLTQRATPPNGSPSLLYKTNYSLSLLSYCSNLECVRSLLILRFFGDKIDFFLILHRKHKLNPYILHM